MDRARDSSREPSRTGTRIAGTFVVRAPIARTELGTIYRAEQEILARSVAILFLRDELARDPVAARRFRDGVQAAARVNHPALVAPIDTGDADDGTPYLVTEHVRGPTLARLLDDEGALAPRRAAAMFAHVLDGLIEIHAADLVHGHLSCGEIFVEPAGGHGEWPKIGGLGLGGVLARGARTGAGDVVDAARVLLDMLDGRDRELDAPRPRVGTISLALHGVLSRALAADPTERFATAEALRDALHEAQHGPLAVEPPDLPAHEPDEARTTFTRLPTHSTDEAIQRSLGRAALGVGNYDAAARHMLSALARALRRGALDDVVDLYDELATVAVRAGDPLRAAAELREAVDVITRGQGPRAETVPSGLWRILLHLAEIERALGNHRAALEAAIHASRHALRRGALDGAARAAALARWVAAISTEHHAEGR
jgi:hypothetical protein